MRRLLERKRASADDAGVSAVEFALVVPWLLLLVFGIIGFGIIFAQQLSLSNGARQGARYGVVADRKCSEIAAEAQNGAATIGMSSANVTVKIWRGTSTPDFAATSPYCTGADTSSTSPCKGMPTGENLYVRTEYKSVLSTPFSKPSFNLSGTGVFRCEFS